MDCSPPDSTVHGIFQARILEWGAISSSTFSLLKSLKERLATFMPWTTLIPLCMYVWRSPLVARMVKNSPAMRETWVGRSPWRRKRLPTPAFWPGEFHGLYSPWDRRVGHNLSDFHFLFMYVRICRVMETTTFTLLDLHPPSPPRLLLTASMKEKISLYSPPGSEHSELGRLNSLLTVPLSLVNSKSWNSDPGVCACKARASFSHDIVCNHSCGLYYYYHCAYR